MQTFGDYLWFSSDRFFSSRHFPAPKSTQTNTDIVFTWINYESLSTKCNEIVYILYRICFLLPNDCSNISNEKQKQKNRFRWQIANNKIMLNLFVMERVRYSMLLNQNKIGDIVNPLPQLILKYTPCGSPCKVFKHQGVKNVSTSYFHVIIFT